MNASRPMCGSRMSVDTKACAILCVRKNGAKRARYSDAGAPSMYQATVVSRYIGLRNPYQHRGPYPQTIGGERMRRTRRAWYNQSSISIMPQVASVLTQPSRLPRRHHRHRRHNLHRPPDRHPPRFHNTGTQRPRPPARIQRQCYRAQVKELARARVHPLHVCLCSGAHQRQPSRAAGARACLPLFGLQREAEERRIRLR